MSLLKPSRRGFIGIFECATIASVTTPTTGAVGLASGEPRTRTSLVLEAIALHRQVAILKRGCTSSEPIGQVDNGIKRGSGSSGLKFWLRIDDAAVVEAQWFSA